MSPDRRDDARRDELARHLHDSLRRAEDEREDATYEQLEAYVDGRLGDVEREILESRLADDPALGAEVDELQALRAALAVPEPAKARVVPFTPAPAPQRGPVRMVAFGLQPVLAAAAVAALLALLVWRGTRPGPDAPPQAQARPVTAPPRDATSGAVPAPAPAVSIGDRGRIVGLTADGRLFGADGVPTDVAARLVAMLRDRRLPASRLGARVASRAGVLMAPDTAATVFRPESPVATAVLTPKPTLRWTALPGARGYRVRIVDDGLQPIAESPTLTVLTWRPPTPLPAGRVLSWQVEADTPDGLRTTPAPPLPEARFAVLPPEEAARAEAALGAMPSDLAAVVVAAEAGLYEEAEAALMVLREGNTSSRVLAALQRDLEARRRGLR